MKNHPDFILETKNDLTIELLRVWRDQLKFLIKFTVFYGIVIS